VSRICHGSHRVGICRPSFGTLERDISYTIEVLEGVLLPTRVLSLVKLRAAQLCLTVGPTLNRQQYYSGDRDIYDDSEPLRHRSTSY
jgi:hypothetical protein